MPLLGWVVLAVGLPAGAQPTHSDQAVVFRPPGDGRLERLVELGAEDWEHLAHHYGRRSE